MYVYADWKGMKNPILIGILHSSAEQELKAKAFKYAKALYAHKICR